MKKRTKSIIITAVFTAFIFITAVLYVVLPHKTFSETEKRYLADFPSFSFDALRSGKFTAGAEEYLSDHVPLRNVLVSIHSYAELLTGNNGSNGVYLGTDGWLLEKPFDRKNSFDMNTEKIVSFSKKTDIPAAIAVVPEKGFIYGDKLPRAALSYDDGEYLARLSDLCGKDVTCIDIAGALQKAKNEKQMFYKTDHHWTTDGAYTGYCEICRTLGLGALPENSFTAEYIDGFYGTSYSTSLYTLTKPDTIKLMKNKETGGAAEITVDEGETIRMDSFFFHDAMEGSDKYNVFLNGNHPLVRIKTAGKGGKLLVIKDSFANCLVPFLAGNYSEIVMLDQRYYKKPVSQLLADEDFSQLLFVYGLENLAESQDIILK